MQKAYINALYEIMRGDKNAFLLLSDSGSDYDLMLTRDFPDRCLNFGIAEQNKIAAASGMAALGKIPFAYTSGAFLAYRAYEFIRDDVCFQNRNVKLVGMASGLSFSQLGPSHHTTEDISVLRSLPNLVIFSPATPAELRNCMFAAHKIKSPVYIRMGMSGEPEIKTDIFDSENYEFEFGKSVTLLNSGADIAAFVTGSIAAEALAALNKLAAEGAGVSLIHFHTIKPLDEETICEAAKRAKYIFTIEEHNVIGGLGSAVSAALAERGGFAPLTRIGLRDRFAAGYGTHKQALRANALDADGIYAAIKNRTGDII